MAQLAIWKNLALLAAIASHLACSAETGEEGDGSEDVPVVDCLDPTTGKVKKVPGATSCPEGNRKVSTSKTTVLEVIIDPIEKQLLTGVMADGFLSIDDSTVATAIIEAATPFASTETVEYLALSHTSQCEKQTGYAATIPTPKDLAGSGDGTYKICIKRTDHDVGHIIYEHSQTFIIDETKPKAAADFSFNEFSPYDYVSVTYSFSPDSNFDYQTVKACTENDCSSETCSDPFTTRSTPVVFESLTNATAYYFCFQGTDKADNTGDWAITEGTYTQDTISPTNPSSVVLSTTNTNLTYSLSFTAGTELNHDSFTLKLCEDTACSTGCAGTTSTTASPGTVTTALTYAVDYYGCVQAVDKAGNTSAWIASSSTVNTDITAPTGTITLAAGATHINSQTPAVTLTADSDATSYKFCSAAQTTGNECTGGDEITAFAAYTTSPAGHNFAADGVQNLYVQFRDDAGNISATFVDAVYVDTAAPTAPSGLSFSATYSTNTSQDLTYTAGSDGVLFDTHQVKLCTDNGCSTACVGASTDSASPASFTSLADGSVLYGCVQSVDAAGNTSSWVASGATITIDTTPPANPTAVAVGAYTNSSISVSFTGGAETNPDDYNLKACTNNDCATGCVGATTTAASPGSISGGLVNGTAYYACVQGLDLAGQTSAWVPSSSTITYDTTPPTGTVTLAAGAVYSATQTPAIALTADADVATYTLCNTSKVAGTACSGGEILRAAAAYTASPAGHNFAADGNTTLYVQFHDQAGNIGATVSDSVHIDTAAPNDPSALSWSASYLNANSDNVTFTIGSDAVSFSTHNARACTANDCTTGCVGTTTSATTPVSVGSLVDGTAYYACLQSVDSAGNSGNWVASAATLTVDQTAPANPSAVTVPSAGNSGIVISFTGGSEANPVDYNIKACTSNDCATGCVGTTTTGSSPGTVSAGLANGTSYYGCVQGVDQVGLTSSWVASASSGLYDTTPPNGTIVLAGAASHTATQSPTIALTADADTADYKLCNTTKVAGAECTGGEELRAFATYTASPAAHNFATDGNETLYVQFRDAAGNISATFSDAVYIDTVQPVAASALSWSATYSNTTSDNLSFTVGSDVVSFSTHNLKACTSNDCTTGCVGATTSATSPVSIGSLVAGSSYYGCAQSVDTAGNTASWVASAATLTIDQTAPTDPSAVTVPAAGNSGIVISFTPGVEANPIDYNIKACTNSDCSTGCVGATTTGSSPGTVSAGLSNGTSYYGCVQAADQVGYTSNWVASSGSGLYDTTAPTGSVSLAAGASHTSSRSPAITLSADADTSHYKICTTTKVAGSECTGGEEIRSFTGYTTTPAVYDFGADGNQTLYIQFRDAAGNISATASDAIYVDTVAPADPASISWASTYANTTSVNATFTDGSDAVSFSTHNIKACTANDCATGCVGASTDSASPATFASLSAGSTYYACVQSVDTAGNTGNWVASGATVTIDQTAPTDPSAVSVPAASNTGITISFTAGTEANPIAFNIKACTNSDCATGCVGATTTASSPGSVSAGLADGTSYYGCVQGADQVGYTSNWVASGSAGLYDVTPPTGTITLAAGAVYSGTQSPAIALTADADVSQYKLCNTSKVAGAECTGGEQLRALTAYSVSPSAYDFAADGAQTLYVQFQDAAGNFSATASDSITIDTANPTAASSPAFSASYMTSSPFTITYSNGSDAVSFSTHNIKACTDSGCTTACVGTTTDAASPVTITGLVEGTAYYACVQSEDSAGNTAAWVASGATAQFDQTAPTAGGGGTITTASVSYTSLDLNWTKATDNVTAQGSLSYRAYYSAVSSFDSVAEVEAGTPVGAASNDIATISVTGLSESTTHYFNVVVEDAAGLKTAYTKVSATTLDDATPPTPGGGGSLSTYGLGATGVGLSWSTATDDVSTASDIGYTVYYSTGSSFDSLVEVEAGTESLSKTNNITTHYITGLTAATTYYINVVVEDAFSNKAVYTKTSITTEANTQKFTQVVAGRLFSCGLTTEGDAYCWGDGSVNQMGDSATTDNTTPGLVSGGQQFIKLSAGEYHVCGITAGGDAYCWGEGDNYRLGDNDTADNTTPGLVSGSHKFVDIAAGGIHTCAITSSRDAYCWGEGGNNQLGDGATTDNPTPALVSGSLKFRQLAAGYQHSCGIVTDGTVYCWGEGSNNQLGDNDTSDHTAPAVIAGGLVYKYLASGLYHTCAITAAGSPYCWGYGGGYQMGDGSTSNNAIPGAVSGSLRLIKLAAYENHSCGITASGAGYCWGTGANYQLGDNAISDNPTPTVISGSLVLKDIAAGYTHSCGLTITGEIHCWGEGGDNQMGDNDTTDHTTASAVTSSGLGGARHLIHLGSGGQHNVAISQDGRAMTWGLGSSGQLGDGAQINRTQMVAINSSQQFKAAAAGDSHSCTLTGAGAAYCWGEGGNGQLGDNGTGNDATAVAVTGSHVFSQISAHGLHSCGIKNDGAAYCWGSDDEGQLGNGGINADQTSPQAVSGSHTFLTVTGGSNHSCGLKDNGTAYCWGDNTYGQLGDGSSTSSSTPVSVTGSHIFVHLVAAGNHSCGIKNDGAAYCWGSDSSGQLGDSGGNNDQSAPTAVTGGHLFRSLVLGGTHSCGIKDDGAAYCWGNDSQGAVGDDAGLSDQSAPTAVSGANVFRSLGAATNHSCGINQDGEAYCWGDDDSGQVGDNSAASDVAVPANVDDGRL